MNMEKVLKMKYTVETTRSFIGYSSGKALLSCLNITEDENYDDGEELLSDMSVYDMAECIYKEGYFRLVHIEDAKSIYDSILAAFDSYNADLNNNFIQVDRIDDVLLEKLDYLAGKIMDTYLTAVPLTDNDNRDGNVLKRKITRNSEIVTTREIKHQSIGLKNIISSSLTDY